MKKKILSVIFLFLIALVLQGCDALYYFTTRDPNAPVTTTTVTRDTEPTESKTNNTKETQSTNTTKSNEETTSKTNQSTSSSNGEVIKREIEASDIAEAGLTQASIDCVTVFNDSQYNTGNYGEKYVSSSRVEFTYYRTTVSTGDNALKLIHASYNSGIDTVGASISNNTLMEGIQYIQVEYKTYSTNAHIMMGYENHFEDEFKLSASTTFTTVTLEVNNANLFIIEEVDSDVFLRNITIYYDQTGDSVTPRTESNVKRINPERYTGTKVAGETTVEMPTRVVYSNNGYEVVETKEYTYYTLAYVQSNSSAVNKAAMTDPVDVINYYIAFGEIPANYAFKDSDELDTVKNVFGNKARVVQSFSRTDGYVRYVPYNSNGLVYYEFDIALDSSYRTNSRGVGRVVMFLNGFSATGYDSSPVAVYTDDHYATFQEYLNDGTFTIRFNAQLLRTDYYHPNTITIEEA